jgi:hypothetical protein
LLLVQITNAAGTTVVTACRRCLDMEPVASRIVEPLGQVERPEGLF